jgi:two-component system chemotaxis sensor kinase CheA
MSETDKYLEIFRDEAREHIEVLRTGLLDLENNPGDLENIKVIMRSAHTIKGSSRMVGLARIGELAHRMEDLVKAFEKGAVDVSTEAINLLLRGTDVIEEAVLSPQGTATPEERFTGAAREIEEFLLRAPPEVPVPADPVPEEEGLVSELESLFGEAPPASKVPPVPSAPPRPAGEDTATRTSTTLEPSPDTMRVKVPQLDNLANLTGELAITKSKIESNSHQLIRIFDYLRETVAAGLDAGPTGRAECLEELDDFVTGNFQRFIEQFQEDYSFLDLYTEEVLSETLNLRLQPVSLIFDRYHRLVRDLKHRLGKKFALEVSGRDILLDKQILEEINPAIMHLIQNAADHGIEGPADRKALGKPETGRIELSAYNRGGSVVIEVKDDGRGIDADGVRELAVQKGIVGAEEAEGMSQSDVLTLIFRDGFTTSEIITGTSGRGVGMSVAWEAVQLLKGRAAVDSSPGEYTRIELTFPPTFYKMKVMLVEAGEQIVCLPASFLVTVARVRLGDMATEGPTPVISMHGRIVPVVDLRCFLGLPPASTQVETRADDGTLRLVLARVDEDFLALRVDRIHRIEEVIVKSPGSYFQTAPLVAGVTILRKGDPSIILNLYNLFKKVQERGVPAGEEIPRTGPGVEKKRILVVDDSITTRTMEKSILEQAGYEVRTAVTGEEGLSLAASESFDAVVTDVEMPGMSGFELTARLRNTVRYKDTPVVIVTSLAREEDKRRGIEVGAQAYIIKGSFEQKTLLETVRRLIGS